MVLDPGGRQLLADALQVGRRQAGEKLAGLVAIFLHGQPRAALQLLGDQGEDVRIGACLGEFDRQDLIEHPLVDLPDYTELRLSRRLGSLLA
ncbi:hypothetical protein FQZ97_1030560 [compost metagenome]